MNLPNRLTILRVFLVPLFVVTLLMHWPYADVVAAAIFILAALTDTLDGYIARKHKQVTKFGKLMDPLADKLLVSGALIALVELGRLSTWVALVIIGREFLITGLRSLAASEGVVIAASPWGKWKTVLQIAAVVGLLIQSHLAAFLGPWIFSLAQALVVVAVTLTVWSAVDYIAAYLKGRKG